MYSFIYMFQAHVVSAFEQSLSNMTQRLQQLTATAEKKVICRLVSEQKMLGTFINLNVFGVFPPPV